MWNHLPWKVVDITVLTEGRHTTFALAELTYTFIFLLGLYHACHQKHQRLHLTIFFAAIVGGLGNDIFFSFLPVVDNFWHAQGMLMITPRFPFYIGAWYVGWLYFSTILVWKMSGPTESTFLNAALTSLLSAMYYAPWDVVGARHLWWTWHASDKMFQHRWLGVPIASTLFTLVFGFCWSLVLHISLFSDTKFCSSTTSTTSISNNQLRSPNDVHTWVTVRTIGSVALFSVPLLLITMPLLLSTVSLSLPPAPPPGFTELWLTLFLLVMLVVICWWRRHHFGSARSPGSSAMGDVVSLESSSLPVVALLAHFGFLLGVTRWANPIHSISTGVHQETGFGKEEGAEVAFDLQGWNRSRYLCAEDTMGSDPYTTTLFSMCGAQESTAAILGQKSREESRLWYTVCGKEGDAESVYLVTIGLVLAIVFHASVVVVGCCGTWKKIRESKVE